MAITIVASPITAVAIDGLDATLDLTTIAGLAQNDVVIVCGAVPRLTAGGTSSTGWTQLDTLDQTIIRGTVWRKVMGATPDTSFVLTGTANAADATVAHARAYRGVDTTTPEDATTTKVAGNSTNPDPAAITTVTNDAWVVAFAASQVNDAAITEPSGYGNAAQINQSDTRPVTMGSADIAKATAGAEDPASWTTWLTANWVSFTVALRPAASGAFTVAAASGSYTITGTAASLERGYLVGASAGSYAITGSDATLKKGVALTAAAGSYAITGSAATLLATHILVAAAGSYSITGTDATLTYVPSVTTSPGRGGGAGHRYQRYWQGKYAGYFTAQEWVAYLLAAFSAGDEQEKAKTPPNRRAGKRGTIVEVEGALDKIVAAIPASHDLIDIELDILEALVRQHISKQAAAAARRAIALRREEEDIIAVLLLAS